MKKRGLYIQSIPQIAEMIVECERLSVEKYREWKVEVMKAASPATKGFTKEVLQVIDWVLFLDVCLPKQNRRITYNETH